MFYKDLKQNIFNVIVNMKGTNFKYNINNLVNVFLSKLYLYNDVCYYGFQCGYLTVEQFNELVILLKCNIDVCALRLCKLYEV